MTKTQNSKFKSLLQRRILLWRKNYNSKVKNNVIASYPEASGDEAISKTNYET
jgi:hypothetical protein